MRLLFRDERGERVFNRIHPDPDDLDDEMTGPVFTTVNGRRTVIATDGYILIGCGPQGRAEWDKTVSYPVLPERNLWMIQEKVGKWMNARSGDRVRLSPALIQALLESRQWCICETRQLPDGFDPHASYISGCDFGLVRQEVVDPVRIGPALVQRTYIQTFLSIVPPSDDILIIPPSSDSGIVYMESGRWFGFIMPLSPRVHTGMMFFGIAGTDILRLV